MSIQLCDMIEGAMNCAENVGRIKAGDEVLILADTTNDLDVIEVYRIAAQLAGGNVSVLIVKSNIAGEGPNEINERGYFVPWPKMAWHAMIASDVTLNLSSFIDIHSLFGAGQGDYGLTSFTDLRVKYKTRLVRVQISVKETLASPYARFPELLLQYIGTRAHQHVVDAIGGAPESKDAVVRVVDPQGTDITFVGFNFITDWRIGGEKDATAMWRDFGSYNVGLQPAYYEENANGVIVTSALHTGWIPEMKITVKDGQGVKIEGGGEVGKKWQMDWEKKKNVISEGRFLFVHKKPGVNWLEECMWATHPKAFSLGNKYRYEGANADHSWFTGSRRSGTLHFALGGGVREEYKHRDVEIFAPTVTVNKETMIEKGRLKVLDMPEVRKEAEKYGDPDELLTEDWIPEIPPR